jgi:transcriptional regulator with XRE-family HTH domain
MSKFSQGNTRGAKLTNEQVFELRRLYNEEGWTQSQLSKHFNLSVNHIGRIVRGESRRAVPMALPEEDHQAAQRRLIELQVQRGTEQVERLMGAAQRAHDQAVQPTKALEELLNPDAEKFGVTTGDSK